MAASLGFEPRQSDPESLVLPLHYEATNEKNKADSSCCKSQQPRQDLGDRDFLLEQDLGALLSAFDFHWLSALCH